MEDRTDTGSRLANRDPRVRRLHALADETNPRAATRHDHHVDWKHLVIYGAIFLVVGVVGVMAIWAFIARQSLVIQPESLPKVTLVTQDAKSPAAAAWVRLLNDAELQPTLVPLEKFDPIEGVVVFCDVPVIPPKLAVLLEEFANRGGAIAFVGKPPATAIGRFRLETEPGEADAALQLAESPSPLLARLRPGHEVAMRKGTVHLLKESPRMNVDARWSSNARAAVMHIEEGRRRYLWFGLDPAAVQRRDPQLLLMLRTAFRWVAGQPISDGAVGEAQSAKTLSTSARLQARENGFAYSVDRTRDDDGFTVRMINRGGRPLANPTVKIWLPPSVTRVSLGGDFLMRRNASVTGMPEDGTCVVSVSRLARNEERVLTLNVETREPLVAAGRQPAGR